ncbi:MAG: 2-C-methyl-D-erythritol 2,4-cyclodiphosphate synthase [Candidatus Omnitrophota bacterium]
MSIGVVIAAGGRSSRFKKSLLGLEMGHRIAGAVDKLLAPFRGQPLIVETVRSFLEVGEIEEIAVAVPRRLLKRVRSLFQHLRGTKIRVVTGGKNRSESVLAGLQAMSSRISWVMVHDGARPLISKRAIRKLLRYARPNAKAGAILAKKVVPTLKEADPRGKAVVRTVDRSCLWEAETPQLFRIDLLRKAFRNRKERSLATDEAMLMEENGTSVLLVENKDWNPKVTTSQDLALIRACQEGQLRREFRNGFGKDLHRLVGGRPLWIGGVRVPAPVGSLGHSDGDVLIHALIDALLGAIGEGDIGEHFPDSGLRWKNADSRVLLKKTLQKIKSFGWKVDAIDSVVSLERPKLRSYKQAIRKALGRCLELPVEQISVKAKTGEGLGEIGKGLAIAAEVLVTVSRAAGTESL